MPNLKCPICGNESGFYVNQLVSFPFSDIDGNMFIRLLPYDKSDKSRMEITLRKYNGEKENNIVIDLLTHKLVCPNCKESNFFKDLKAEYEQYKESLKKMYDMVEDLKNAYKQKIDSKYLNMKDNE